MATERSARERFVEAMDMVAFYPVGKNNLAGVHWKRQAIVAFADVECQPKIVHGPHEAEGCGCHFDPAREDGHTSCRAALLKECGLE